MKTRKAPPGARRLIESLRNLGYECSTAIADLIDNSLAAGASEISVEVNASTEGIPAHIIIGDNGKGMNRDSLFEAMRFGAFQDYSNEDLGKYGLGLKTASLSQCTKLTVASKPSRKQGGRATKSIACWDLSHVYKTDDWDLITPSFSDLDAWEQAALDHETARGRGTVVVWSGLDEAHPLLCARNAGQRDHYLARLITEISDHLRMVFHRFMQGMVRDRPKLRLSVSGVELSPWDPFCLTEKGTESLDIVKPPVLTPGDSSSSKKTLVTMIPYVLPREDEFSSREAWKEASGPKTGTFNRGFTSIGMIVCCRPEVGVTSVQLTSTQSCCGSPSTSRVLWTRRLL
ncbi:MAG: ATP-binding protein [Elusimicrobia bacterium]|nr:ATP-binding protein [Elusimicrobiota bacterium]